MYLKLDQGFSGNVNRGTWYDKSTEFLIVKYWKVISIYLLLYVACHIASFVDIF